MYQKLKRNILSFFKSSSALPQELSKKVKTRLIFILFFEIIAIVILSLEVNLLGLFGTAIPISKLKNPDYAIATEVYTADSVLIGKYYKENRTPVNISKIDTSIIQALIATEDVRFYKHFGIDPLSSLSVFYYAVKGDNRGGSTITQQLVKNLFKTRKSGAGGLLGKLPIIRTVIYKTKEWITAFKIEFFYTKQEILNMYLNTVDFGNNSFGIEVASKQYFNKSANTLSIDQAAILVGMLKAPSTYNPIKRPAQAIERRNVVLGQMFKYKIISKSLFDSLIKMPLRINPKIDNGSDDNGSYLRVAVSNYLKTWCKENEYDLYADGLKIYTTIDSKMQKHAENAMQNHLKLLQQLFYNHWGKEKPWRNEKGQIIEGFLQKLVKRTLAYQNIIKNKNLTEDSIQQILNTPKKMKVFTWKGDKDTTFSTYDSLTYYLKILNSGMMCFEPTTGYIKTWVGGINYKYFKYDHVKQMHRQAGSTFKPFAYVAAIDNGYSPCDQFIDKGITVKYTENGEQKTWTPHNADWIFTGKPYTLRRAMGKSVNSITAQITEKIGWDKVKQYAQACGVKSELASVPSICLGSNDVSIHEMVASYGTFLNKGIYTEPLLVKYIYDKEGELVKNYKPETRKALSEETSWLMLHMFRGSIEEPGGTSQALWAYDVFKNGNEIGGKTGTSSNHSDGWYIGITAQYVTGVWVGASERSVHFRTSQLGEGSKTALPVFAKFMENCLNDKSCNVKAAKFPKPFVAITKKYYCPSKWEVVDTLKVFIDTIAVENEMPIADSISVID